MQQNALFCIHHIPVLFCFWRRRVFWLISHLDVSGCEIQFCPVRASVFTKWQFSQKNLSAFTTDERCIAVVTQTKRRILGRYGHNCDYTVTDFRGIMILNRFAQMRNFELF